MQVRHRAATSMALLVVSAVTAGCAGIGVGVAGGSGQGFGVGLSVSPDALFRRSSPAGAVVPPPRVADPSAAPVPPIVETFESSPAPVAR